MLNTEDIVVNALSQKSFNAKDILSTIKNINNPLESMVAMKQYSLTWIVKQIFNNESGRPLELLPFQSVLLDMLWNYKYPMVLASRGAGKSFIYAVYALLRALLLPGSKICIVGAGFRQAKIVFSYVAKLYMSSPLVIEAIQHDGGPKYAVDQCSIKVGNSTIFAIPLGDGERIRGMRANVILTDEFASISDEIFEFVVQPFAAVHKDPGRHVKITSLLNKLKKHNAPPEIIKIVEDQLGFGNQICISGTATYEFNHFYRKYEMYRKIIFSEGNNEVVSKAFADGNKYLIQGGKLDDEALKAFKHTDYAIYQLPYFGLPEGFMDAGIIANARLTFEPIRFGMEFLCKFAKDSDGFYKRSLIQGATPTGEEAVVVELYGESGAQYVMGVDPARHNDNCTICILKLTNRGYELVYSWAIRGKSFDVVVKQIRTLMDRFNIIYIAMDQGGGGSHIRDMLSGKKYLEDGEQPIWDIENEEAKFQPGLKILECFQWSNEWVRENNYAMKAEIRQRQLLFPNACIEEQCLMQYSRQLKRNLDKHDKDIVYEELYGALDNEGNKKVIDGIWDNIQETINEMCAIIVKATEGGQETFILPPLSIQQKNQSMTDARRRDRYSALLLAAYAARKIRGTGHKKTDIGGGTDIFFRKRGSSSSIKRSGGGTAYPVF